MDIKCRELIQVIGIGLSAVMTLPIWLPMVAGIVIALVDTMEDDDDEDDCMF